MQFEQRLAHGSLGNTEFSGQALLAEPLPGFAFAGQNPALDFLADMMPGYASCHRIVPPLSNPGFPQCTQLGFTRSYRSYLQSK